MSERSVTEQRGGVECCDFRGHPVARRTALLERHPCVRVQRRIIESSGERGGDEPTLSPGSGLQHEVAFRPNSGHNGREIRECERARVEPDIESAHQR